jgi:hypothetical protein
MINAKSTDSLRSFGTFLISHSLEQAQTRLGVNFPSHRRAVDKSTDSLRSFGTFLVSHSLELTLRLVLN